MTKLAGVILDTYDDPTGSVLRAKIQGPSDIPDFIKSAARIGDPDAIPDDEYALVMLDKGSKLKKYAMNDKGNTALSVLYLLEQGHQLPDEVVKVAASRLCLACEQYDMVVPEQLKVAAVTGSTKVPASTKPTSLTYMAGAKPSTVNFPVTENAPLFTENPQLGKADEHAEIASRTNLAGVAGSNFIELPQFSQKEKIQGSTNPDFHKQASGVDEVEIRTRIQGYAQTPYVDTSNMDLASNPQPVTPPTRTLLDGQYPVDSYDQVKTAAEYFGEYWKQMSPSTRHEYCVKLASRMVELGVQVPEAIDRYGSTGYSADVDDLVELRKNVLPDEYHSAVDALIEKRASVHPESFAKTLEELDKMAGLNWSWDAEVVDPYFVTFGPSLEKLANREWRYDELGTRTNALELESLARNGRELIKKTFGEKFADEFQKSPVDFFKALPNPQKLLLGRLSMDRHAGTATE